MAGIPDPAAAVRFATALAKAALAVARPGARAYLVQGRYEHVNFIWDPRPVRVQVTEVVPPLPAKLFAMAAQVVDYDEDLPPIELVLDAVDLRELAWHRARYRGEHCLFAPADPVLVSLNTLQHWLWLRLQAPSASEVNA